MNAWSQLPNAHHIDWVIESVKNNPGVWAAARSPARYAELHAAWTAAWTVDRHEFWAADWKTVLDAVDHSHPAFDTTWSSIAALIAYDDCDQYLSMTYEELYVWSKISESTQAILLLPLKWVQEHEQQSLVAPA